jgi:SAM-dependent methyltransferase
LPVSPSERQARPASARRRRGRTQRLIDFVTFPIRALTLFERDRGPLSSLATERYDYVSREVAGRCLDVGCGRQDRFIREWCGGEGAGIDVFPYEGLKPAQILADPTRFPFPDASFGTVTFIANLNHVPEPLRDCELAEAHRCLVPGGRIVVTMGNPLAEILVHRVVALYDRVFGTRWDVDSERGMGDEEAYYLLDGEIVARLRRAGFGAIRKKRFWTQWGLNHLLVGTE